MEFSSETVTISPIFRVVIPNAIRNAKENLPARRGEPSTATNERRVPQGRIVLASVRRFGPTVRARDAGFGEIGGPRSFPRVGSPAFPSGSL